MSEGKQVVIYKVKITGGNPGAWYKIHENLNKTFECVPELFKPNHFTPEEIYWRFLGCTPAKFIKQEHAQVVSQRLASNLELLDYMQYRKS